jgi:hypothetical protein
MTGSYVAAEAMTGEGDATSDLRGCDDRVKDDRVKVDDATSDLRGGDDR